ncbi:MFS transporter [Hirsutella rhossiliensis]|uniref:MFS transporter n=1 Tax=Hirsutella rhossiliensis TaxID=111463 RepID=A0A9P8MT47_9HYPO|nr:MFS transporter [Hirsutella rhossiliensis]KAH0961508.1 MFS transporter [Hirsutella rhossiliensis]
MTRLQLLVALILSALAAVASAASAPTFCKCTCFKNSTIIPLGPASQLKTPSSSPSLLLRSFFSVPDAAHVSDEPRAQAASSHSQDRRSASTSCSECTKAFCLSQGIAFCKDAKEENVVTMCFQRDSNKDKFIVWGFILGTVGLLGWATFKRVVEWREGRAMDRQGFSYSSVAGNR